MRKQIAFYLSDTETLLGKLIDLVLVAINIFACILFVVDSYLGHKAPALISSLEIIVVGFFIAEYVLRVWCDEKPILYVISFYGIIDVVSIFPFFLTNGSLTFLRALKVLRILRFLRYLETQNFFFGKLSKIQLQVARTFFTIIIILFVSSGFIYYVESAGDGRLINTFGDSFYFCVTTLTTVGFGDLVPVTPLGRFFTVIMILFGIVLIPWQAGRLVKVLVESDTNKKKVTCPNCGLTSHDFDASHCKACGSIIYQEYGGEA